MLDILHCDSDARSVLLRNAWSGSSSSSGSNCPQFVLFSHDGTALFMAHGSTVILVILVIFARLELASGLRRFEISDFIQRSKLFIFNSLHFRFSDFRRANIVMIFDLNTLSQLK